MVADTPRYALALVIALTVIGAGLRIYGLDFQSLWSDELDTWRLSNQPDLVQVLWGLVYDVHPPAYQILMYAVERTIGDSEIALRMPSAIAGIIAIPLMFALGRQLFSYREGLVAAALLTFLAPGIQYSQEARSYELLLMFALLLTLLLVLVIKQIDRDGRPTAVTLVAFSVTVLLTGQLHYYGLILTGVYALYLFVRFFKSARFLWPAAAYIPLFISYLLWIGAITKHLSRGTGWLTVPESFSVAFMDFLSFTLTEGLAPYALSIVLISGLIELYRHKDERVEGDIRWREPWVILLLMFLGPFLIAYFASFLLKPMYFPKYLIAATPAVYLLLARSIFVLRIPPFAQGVIACTLILVSSFTFLIDHKYYSTPHKDELRQAITLVLEDARDRTDTDVIGWAFHVDNLEYYFEHLHSKRRIGEIVGADYDLPRLEAKDKLWARRGVRRVWYIRNLREVHPVFWDALMQRGKIVQHEKKWGVELWLIELHERPPTPNR